MTGFKKDDDRMERILATLLNYIQKDFSQTIPVSDRGDELDALSLGLNTMAEEFQAYISQLQEKKAHIKALNAELSQKVAAGGEEIVRNEKLFRTLIEKNADMMTLALPGGELIYASPSVTHTLGFTLEEYRSKPAFEFIHPEDLPSVMEGVMGIVERPGKSVFLQHRLLHKDGSYRWCEGTFTNMLHDPDIGALVSNFRDITIRKETEDKIKSLHAELEQKVIDRTAQLELKMQQLQESEEKFQKAFQTSAAGMSITRLSDSVYVDVNEALVQMTGYSKEEMVGHTSTELGIIVNFEQRERVLNQVRQQGFAKDFEISIQHRSGFQVEVLASIDTILLKGEKYAINILYDITERKHAEAQLAIANQELEAFSYSVSHDLRAPARAVNFYSDVLGEDYGHVLDDEGRRLLQSIKLNAEKMGTLIDELLAFSRLGRQEVRKVDVDMNQMVANVVNEVCRFHKSSPTIQVGALHAVKADHGLLNQVMFNLISNAVKYSSKKENPMVEIASEVQADEIVFSVKDNGVGFDMRYAKRLFVVFQRMHSQEEFEGTGVGLAIVHRIVTKHGGRVWAEAKLNEGATFYFTLENGNSLKSGTPPANPSK